jgi:hypothetical protein
VRGDISYVDDAEWEDLIKDFKIEERNSKPYKGQRWAVVSKENNAQP